MELFCLFVFDLFLKKVFVFFCQISSLFRHFRMLFHDVHHAFPNAVGTLSQRGRFHGWEKVHDAAAEVLHRGLWKPNGDEETQMQKTQKKRSLMMKQGK